MSLYTKNADGEYIPININTVLGNDLNNKLVIVRVGSDAAPASIDDVDATARSFSRADILDDLDNVSIILTPYEINIDVVDDEEVSSKSICIQIEKGQDISALEKSVKTLYKELTSQHDNVTVVPTPLTIRDYQQVKETLERCKIRKQRRSKSY